jgi:hypothetical protein
MDKLKTLHYKSLITIIKEAGKTDYLRRRQVSARKYLRYKPSISTQVMKGLPVDQKKTFSSYFKGLSYESLLSLATMCGFKEFVGSEEAGMMAYIESYLDNPAIQSIIETLIQ